MNSNGSDAHSTRFRSMRARTPVRRIRAFFWLCESRTLVLSELLGQLVRNALQALGRKVASGLPGRAGGRSRVVPVVAGAVACLMLASYAAGVFPNAYAVELDGRRVAVVSDYADVEEAVRAFLLENSDHYDNIHYTDDIAYIPVRVGRDEISCQDEIAALCRDLSYVAVGYRMFIDGEEVAVLHSRQEGEALVSQIIESYQPEVRSGELTVRDVTIREDIRYVREEVDIEEFTDKEAFRNFLLYGQEVLETYTVKKNDTLSQIAQRFSISTADLREANPRHRDGNTFLQIGEVLNLNVVEKPLHVVVEGTLVREESIPYQTRYTNDSNLWRGQYRTVTAGVSGARSVEYSVVFENGQEVERAEVAQSVIREPETKVVASGTRYIMASRGDGGSGVVAWPLRGRITSAFGWRRTGFHSGIDIAGNTGDPIYAAESGTVIYAAWSGGYGRLIRIDHGDGLATWYAHLSAYRVSTGDRVSRGDLIGLVGSSGNSTGPHLHFEVRINGVAKNPVNYLQ